jgi:hypothetical protein
MPTNAHSPYSLKRLRELCVGIHEENIAFLLRTTLADFPIPVIDEFFTGPKLNKPSGPDEREWTDIVRLTLIAFAPEGSEPARLRGKRIPRYKRSYPFDANRDDADNPGLLTLYPTEHTSPLLAEIAAQLSVKSLRIECSKWLTCFLENPFPLHCLTVRNAAFPPAGRSGWTPGQDSKADLAEIITTLPDHLEELELSGGEFPLSGNGISRLERLKKITIYTMSLPDGVDFSANTALEEIKLEITKGTNRSITGISALQQLKSLSVICKSGWIPCEPMPILFERRVEQIELKGVVYLGEKIEGCPARKLKLSAKGLRHVALSPSNSKPSDRGEFIHIVKSPDLLSVSIEAEVGELRVSHCEQLADLNAKTYGEATDLVLKDCAVLSKADVFFERKAAQIVLEDLPALSDVTLTSPSGCSPTSGYTELSAKFLMKNTGLTKMPVLKGAWRECSIIELFDNQKLASLDGIEALPDLNEIRVKRQSGMTGFLTKDAAQQIPSVRTIKAEQITLSTPARFDVFTNLENLNLIACNGPSREEPLSLFGVEALECLATVDLSSSSVQSLAPLAGLPNLKSVKVSGCGSLKPKSPRVLLQGPLLASELARHVGPDHPSLSKMPSTGLLKIVDLIGEGARSDVGQALALLPALEPEEKAKLVRGAAIDPETGWIRLPYLSNIDENQARGIPQLRILQAADHETSLAVLSSATSVFINNHGDHSSASLRFGKAKNQEAGDVDDILEEFDSLRSLPDLPNLTKISINGFSHHSQLSRFSMEGAERFPKVTELYCHHVAQIDGLAGLANFTALEELRLCGLPLKNLTGLGSHPSIRNLTLRCDLESLEGIEHFPALKSLHIQSTEDMSPLLVYSKRRDCRITFKGSPGDNDMFWWVRFEFHPRH